MMIQFDFGISFLFLFFISSVLGLIWYVSTAKWWIFLLGRAIVAELAGSALISGFLSTLVVFPHQLPIIFAVLIYFIEAAVHSALAVAIIASARSARKLRQLKEREGIS